MKCTDIHRKVMLLTPFYGGKHHYSKRFFAMNFKKYADLHRNHNCQPPLYEVERRMGSISKIICHRDGRLANVTSVQVW